MAAILPGMKDIFLELSRAIRVFLQIFYEKENYQ